jgi:hypothetical protein
MLNPVLLGMGSRLPLGIAAGTAAQREFEMRLEALKNFLHPSINGPTASTLAELYANHRSSASKPEEQQSIMMRIKMLEDSLDLTEYNKVFGAVDRAFAQVGACPSQQLCMVAAVSARRECSPNTVWVWVCAWHTGC